MKTYLIVLLLILVLPWGAFALEPGCNHYGDFLQTFAELYPDPAYGAEGWYRDLAIKGQYAYSVVAYYSNQPERLQILDLSDPLDPQFLGFAGLGARDHTCLDIWDHYVFVGGPGLKIVDVDDEAAPQLVNTLTSVSNVGDLVVGPGRLCATDAWSRVQIFDLAFPENPILVGTITPGFTTRALALQGDLLAVGGNERVSIYNIANPAFPALVGSLAVEGIVGMLEWDGDQLVAGGHNELYLIDTSDPALPDLEGMLPLTGAVSAVLEDEVLWVGCGYNGRGSLERWDLSDPSAFSQLGRTACVGVPFGLERAFGHTYTANWADDYAYVYLAPLVVFTGSELGAPPHLGRLYIDDFYSENTAGGMRDGILYLVGELEIEVVDLSDPREPELGDPVWIGGGYVYGNSGAVVGPNLLVRRWDLINNSYYHDIYSLDDPLHPEYAGSSEEFSAATVRGNLLYSSSTTGVHVYESLDTHRLEPLGTLFPGSSAGWAVFDADMAAFMYGTEGILLGEMTGPVEVAQLGMVPPSVSGSWLRPLAMGEGLLVGYEGPAEKWHIWDVSDPAQPVLLLTRPAGYNRPMPSRCFLRDGILYIDGTNVLEVWDLTDRTQLERIGEWPHPGGWVNIYPQDEYMVAQGRYGVITALPLQCDDLSAAPWPDPQDLLLGLDSRAAPNPTHGTTHISFTLSEGAEVVAAVYDLRGRLVRRLEQRWLPAGRQGLFWNGRDAREQAVASGVYLVKVEAGRQQATERVVLLR